MEAVPAILGGERLERRDIPTPAGLEREEKFGPAGREVTFKRPISAKILDPQVRANLDIAKRYEAQADKHAKRGAEGREIAKGYMDLALQYTQQAGDRMIDLYGGQMDQVTLNEIEVEQGSEIVNYIKRKVAAGPAGRIPGVKGLLEVPTKTRRELVPRRREGVVPGRPAPADITADISQANTVATAIREMVVDGELTREEARDRLKSMEDELLRAYPDRAAEIRKLFKVE
jgi:hypothetical protein